MRLKHVLILILALIASRQVQAQVWYPEGVYLFQEPHLITVDNQLMTIGRSGIDANSSYWTIAVSDGKVWKKLPTLVLNKTAEVTQIKKYKNIIYVSGVFTFDGGKFSSLVRFDGFKWVGLANFSKTNLSIGGINAMNVHDNQLLLGGSFQIIDNDTIPYLVKFDGTKFYRVLECKGCDPDNFITDIESNDSIVAISGGFTRINGSKSKYLVRLRKGRMDTFVNTPKIPDLLALNGEVIYMSGGILKGKGIYLVDGTNFIDLKSNLDSSHSISEMLIYEGKLVICGALSLKSATTVKQRVTVFTNSTWSDVSNNYKGVRYIATGRAMLFAIGRSESPISIWNPNRNVMRFYPGLSLVRAKAFIDSNNNCIMEPNEKPAPKQYIKLPFINKGVFTNVDGMTEFMVPNSSSSTFRFVVKPFRNFVKSNCADTSVTKTFIPGQYFDSIQFPLNRIPNVSDIRVLISSPKGKLVLKNKRVVYYITYENVGSNPISGKIRLRKNKFFSSELCLPLQTKVNDSIVEWNYSNLQPGESKVIYYSGMPDASQFDNNFQFDAMVSSQISSGSNTYSDDDSDSIPQEVNSGISAFRKDVYPTPELGDSITYLAFEDRDLRYNISFNNFGDDTVFYAVVIDTLDLNLDMSYIQETGSNKSYYTEVQTDPNNQYKGIIIWHFPNIKLAPNPTMDYENPNSGAYIGFKVNTKPLSKGYFLKNVASVFYDNSYAGSTNAVYCTLALTDIDDVSKDESRLKVYPNPSNGTFVIDYPFVHGDVISVYNASGQLILMQYVDSNADVQSIELDDVSPGIYFIQVGGIGKKVIVE